MSFQILIFLIRKPFDAIFCYLCYYKVYSKLLSEFKYMKREWRWSRDKLYGRNSLHGIRCVRVRIPDADGEVNAAAARDDVAQGIIWIPEIMGFRVRGAP